MVWDGAAGYGVSVKMAVVHMAMVNVATDSPMQDDWIQTPGEAPPPTGSADLERRRKPAAHDRATAGAGSSGSSSSAQPGGRALRGRWTRWLVGAFVVAWSAALVGPPVALLRWREARLAVLADPAAQADWDAFREDMRRQSGRDGPVQRKVPRSAEPPERVWLRDHVGLAITAWITLGTVLGGFLALTLRGLLTAGRDAPRAT